MLFPSARLLIPAQAAAAIVGVATLTMWPPASGRMMLVPLTGGDAGSVARVAVAGGASLLGTGPLPGSLVVMGDRSRVARQVGSRAIVIIAAPPAGCGTGDAPGDPA